MKRRASILLLLSVGIGLMAQPRLVAPEYYLGVQGGVLASMVQFDPDINQKILDPHLGGNAGLVFRYAGHKYCGLQVELNWMERGWHEAETGYNRSQHYIELPLLFHLYFGKKVRGFINLGPQIGYCLAESNNGVAAEEIHQYLPIDNAIDWGVAGGLGLYGISKVGVWQIEGRFNYSLGDMYSNRSAHYFARSAPMNLSLNFAWLWEIKRKQKD